VRRQCQSLLRHRKTDQLGDAGGRTQLREEKTLIHQLLPGEAQRAKDAASATRQCLYVSLNVQITSLYFVSIGRR